MIINGYDISILNDNLLALDGKEGKSGFVIPHNVNPLIYYLFNFKFMVFLILCLDSKVTKRVGTIAKIIEMNQI